MPRSIFPYCQVDLRKMISGLCSFSVGDSSCQLVVRRQVKCMKIITNCIIYDNIYIYIEENVVASSKNVVIIISSHLHVAVFVLVHHHACYFYLNILLQKTKYKVDMHKKWEECQLLEYR